MVQALLRRLAELVPEIRWTSPDNVHITLKFFGNLEPERAGAVVDAIHPVAASAPAFPVQLADWGGFPSRRRPHVLWLGLGMGSDELVRLASACESVLEPLGFVAEGRPFRPHCTLGRLRQEWSGPVRQRCEEILDGVPESPLFLANEVVLFESLTGPRGARHQRRASVLLQRG